MANPIVNIKFLADLQQFSTGMQNASRKMEKLGSKLKSVGTTLSVGVTAPLTAFAVASVKNFDTQAKAIAQVETGLKSTGNAAGFTSDQLQKMASALQNNSLFGDEQILKDVTAQLLTFTNISGTAFSRTQQAALDLATRLDGDVKSATIQLGKALNDPVANLSALSRSGIQFSNEQKTLINSLVATNRAAEAQDIILTELEKQYGGSAEAAAKAGTGPLKQLSNILGDITEEFGAIIVEGILPLVDYVKDLALRFQALSPQTKKFIVILGGVAAAIGPLLALAGTILPAIGTGFALLTGPIGLIVAGLTAVGVIIYKNWAPIKQTLIEIANYFIDLYNESTAFRIGVEYIITSFKNVLEVGKYVFGILQEVITAVWKNIVDGFKNLGKIIKAVLTGDVKSIPGLISGAFKTGLDNGFKAIQGIQDRFKPFKEAVTGNVEEGINNALRGKKYELLADNVETDGVQSKVAESVKKGIQDGVKQGLGGVGRGKVSTIGPEFNFDDTGDVVQDIIDRNKFKNLDKIVSPVTEIVAKIPEENEILRAGLKETETILLDFSGQLQGLAMGVADTFGEFLGNIVSGQQGFADLFGNIMGLVSDFLKNLGRSLIEAGTAAIAFTKLISNPFAAIGAGVALVALSKIVENTFKRGLESGARPFANGGIVYGPTNALIGEYAGARSNPEVVAPLDKLKGMLNEGGGGQMAFIPDVVLRGEDLVMSFERTNKKKSRIS
ncbi:phage tail length tape measure family protein [Galbibacter sp. BG1]|uniref:phage tail length tape measure family protein n=1 Tax=Galbibacter sp. BG1 TaxID=1170699 RepID=UPI0015C18633|nr:phage tail length tape measure family protein [Galbibacter sp. BG1]QLE02880.1 phage tail length tape measure family protein [Galbibacter sp. BG1]